MAGLVMTSCDDQNDASYTPATPGEPLEYYFSMSDPNSAELVETDTEFTVILYRTDGSEEVTVPVECTATDATLFNIPASATFEAGKTQTGITVTFDATKLQGMIPYKFVFKVGDSENTPYALQTVEYTVTYRPWDDVIGPNGELYALYTDDVMGPLYGGDNLTYEVKLQSSPSIEGLYRIVNPYGESFPYNEPGDWDDTKNYYLYFNIANPNVAFLCDGDGNAVVGNEPYKFYSGVCWNESEGEMFMTGMYNVYMAMGSSQAVQKATEFAGTYKKGVLTFPKDGLGCKLTVAHAGTTDTEWVKSNKNGAFKLVWPGVVEEVDPEPETKWQSIGTGEYTDPLIYPLFEETQPMTWTVEVEQNTDEPTKYRMVNPYKAGIMPDGIDYEDNLYIEIDAANPEAVVIAEQNTGFIDGQDGIIYMMNAAGYLVANGVPLSTVISKGYGDTFNNGVFTFPAGHMMCSFPNSPDPEVANGGPYGPTINIEGKLVLNNEAAVSAASNIRAARAKTSCRLIDVKAKSSLGKHLNKSMNYVQAKNIRF